jgi:glycosyltransferase involved in cell wall biosynthesis
LPWSTWVRQSLVADYGVDPGRVEVVPPGVDLDTWQPGPPRETTGPLRILFVGGDLYRKGGALLLEAFRALPAGLASLTLVTRATDLAGQPDITVYNHLQPNSAELIDLYQQSDVFVLPTQAEAFGIAAIEASASGLPVIATATGGLVDIVLPGQSGFLIEPDDAASLARHLHFLAEHPAERRQMGQVGRERASALFDARRNAARVVELLHAAPLMGRNR